MEVQYRILYARYGNLTKDGQLRMKVIRLRDEFSDND